MYNREALCPSLPHQFQLHLGVGCPHPTLHTQAMGNVLVALPCFQLVFHFLYAFATPPSFAVPGTPVFCPWSPYLPQVMGNLPLVWWCLHKITKPLSKESPAPHCQLHPISVKQFSSFEEGPPRNCVHSYGHAWRYFNGHKNLRSRDRIFISNWCANISILKIFLSGLLLRQEETQFYPSWKLRVQNIESYKYVVHMNTHNHSTCMLSSWLTADWLTLQLIPATEV